MGRAIGLLEAMGMNFGVALPAQVHGLSGADVVAWLDRIERHGFDSVWVLDRLVYESFAPIPLLAAAAASTSRARIGTSILLAPLHNPLILAKDLATLDQLSNGRLTLGVGVGAREPDFLAAEVPMAGRGRRLEEMLAIMKQAWAGKPIEHDGRAFQYHLPPSGPKTVQQPHPPIRMGGAAPAALRRAARLADGYIVGGGGPAVARKVVPEIRAAVREAGRDSASFPLAALSYFHLDSDLDRAVQAINGYIEAYYGRQLFDPREGATCGTPEHAAARFKEYADLQVETMILVPCSRDWRQVDRLLEAVERFNETAKLSS
jgi:probable F420-dependent oxidoreductase